MIFEVQLGEEAKADLKAIGDTRVQRLIVAGLRRLAESPAARGKPLRNQLAGYFSVRLAGERYRAIYTIDDGFVRVIAIAIRRDGDRRDAYQMAVGRK